MIAQHMLHSHPAVQAAKITSNAMRDAYLAQRAIASTRSTHTAKRQAVAALEKTERIHEYVTKILKATPDAWFSFDTGAMGRADAMQDMRFRAE
jgi:hypothetical protein